MNSSHFIISLIASIIIFTNIEYNDADLDAGSINPVRDILYENNYKADKKVNFDDAENSVVTALFHDGIHSRHSAPQSLFRYSRCYFLITAAEMQTSGFPSGVNITSLGYNYKYGTDVAAKGYFKVYFENTTDVTNNKSSNWNSAITQMSLVNSDTLQIQIQHGVFDITLNEPENFIYTGGGIYVAFEYSNPNGPLATISNVAWANKVLPNPILKSSQSDDSLRVIATGSSNLRPETRFGCNKIDIVSAGPVYSMGAIGFYPGADTNFIKTVINHTRNIKDTIILTTRVKRVIDGFIKYIFIDTIITERIESKTVSHNYFIENALNADSIISEAVSNNEDITGNNKSTYKNIVTVNTWNHFIPSLNPNGGAGLSVGTGDYVARFHTPACLTLCAIDMSFFADNGQGSNSYKVVIYSADGPGGSPGSLLHTSPLRISPAGNTGIIKRSTYFLPSPVTICGSYYYAGYSQTDARNLRVSYQIENPIRPNEFYYSQPAGTANWIEFAEISPYKIDVAPRTYLTLRLKVFLEGFFNGDKMIPDTVKVILRNQIPPYTKKDSASVMLDSNGTGNYNFINANSDSCYYYEVIHRNHITTYSHNSCEKLNGAPSIFDFTSSSSKAFGINMTFIQGQISPGGYAIYSGDVNQDGIIDATDASAIDNDVLNFMKGYVNTDLTGDNVVDAGDAAIAENNSARFITKIIP
ncbi:MAG: hypothetical protein ABIY50_13380 [Ignavibacteria bacterium]